MSDWADSLLGIVEILQETDSDLAGAIKKTNVKLADGMKEREQHQIGMVNALKSMLDTLKDRCSKLEDRVADLEALHDD